VVAPVPVIVTATPEGLVGEDDDFAQPVASATTAESTRHTRTVDGMRQSLSSRTDMPETTEQTSFQLLIHRATREKGGNCTR
jgi:hypothetical protein